MRIDLAGRPALVVGPGGPIRAATAGALAANGAAVAEAGLEGAIGAMGRTPPYILVHVSAGAEQGPVEPPEMAPDVAALAMLVRAAAPSAKRIVNILSVAGVVPIRRAPVFSAGEASLVSLTRSLAMELGGDGVAVNGLAVGAFAGQAGAAAESLLSLETQFDETPLFDALVDVGLGTVENGAMAVPGGTGTGVRLAREPLRRHRVAHWATRSREDAIDLERECTNGRNPRPTSRR